MASGLSHHSFSLSDSSHFFFLEIFSGCAFFLLIQFFREIISGTSNEFAAFCRNNSFPEFALFSSVSDAPFVQRSQFDHHGRWGAGLPAYKALSSHNGGAASAAGEK
jgi:hypothetical protein